MSDATGWFDTRVPPPPAALAAALAAAAVREPTPARLAESALDRLGAAIELCPDRAAALELLAADALLTYAFEAAAEDGLGAVADVLGRLTPAHFAALVPAAPGTADG